MSTEVITTLAELVRINSVNPAYAQGQAEAAIAAWIRQFFLTRGVALSEHEVSPGRSNLVAVLPGQNPGRRLVFEAHMDTAGVDGMTEDPFSAHVENGFLYGRGACDTKGGLAAMMHALADVKAAGKKPPCEIWLAATVDEEHAYSGIADLCKSLTADAAVVAEPTDLRLTVACKGCVRWRTHVLGTAAHSSKPHLGVNAIAHMAQVVLALTEDNRGLDGHVHPLLGPATCNIGTIVGGAQVNIVPDRCTIELDRRLLPGEAPDDVLKHHSDVLEAVRHTQPGLRYEVEEPMLVDYALDTATDAPIVTASSAVLTAMNLAATPIGVPFGCDASKLARAGVPSIVFGPGSIDQAHAAIEFVDCQQVEQARVFYRDLMLTFEP